VVGWLGGWGCWTCRVVGCGCGCNREQRGVLRRAGEEQGPHLLVSGFVHAAKGADTQDRAFLVLVHRGRLAAEREEEAAPQRQCAKSRAPLAVAAPARRAGALCLAAALLDPSN